MAQPQPSGGFNWNRLSMGSKGLIISSLLLFIDLFFPWRAVKGCTAGVEAFGVSCNISGFSTGLGVLVSILAIVTIVLEVLPAAGVNINLGATSPALIGAIAGGATALFALITFLMSFGGGVLGAAVGISWGAFVGLILGLALAYAAYVRFQESQVGGTSPPPAA